MAEAKERSSTPVIPSDMQAVLKRCENLEKEVRSLKLNLSFMNRWVHCFKGTCFYSKANSCPVIISHSYKAIYSSILTNHRKDSEQTKQIEELQKQNEELTEEKERLLEEIERVVSDSNTWSPNLFSTCFSELIELDLKSPRNIYTQNPEGQRGLQHCPECTILFHAISSLTCTTNRRGQGLHFASYGMYTKMKLSRALN